jgi:hypothetical protein
MFVPAAMTCRRCIPRTDSSMVYSLDRQTIPNPIGPSANSPPAVAGLLHADVNLRRYVTQQALVLTACAEPGANCPNDPYLQAGEQVRICFPASPFGFPLVALFPKPNRIHLVLFGMQYRTFGPIFWGSASALRRIPIPAERPARRERSDWVYLSVCLSVRLSVGPARRERPDWVYMSVCLSGSGARSPRATRQHGAPSAAPAAACSQSWAPSTLACSGASVCLSVCSQLWALSTLACSGASVRLSARAPLAGCT